MQILPDKAIINKIYVMRGKKVMADRDLAELYGVETRVLNQAVRRNGKRFPEDFMFQMTSKEVQDWKSQIVISNTEKMGLRKPPLVFTEQGVAMLSSVLNSERAVLLPGGGEGVGAAHTSVAAACLHPRGSCVVV